MITDLTGFVKKQFEMIEKRFERQEKRFDAMKATLESHGQILELHQDTMEKMHEDLRDIRQGQLLHDRRFDELESVVRATAKAVDKDAVKVIDHERRLIRLEHAKR